MADTLSDTAIRQLSKMAKRCSWTAAQTPARPWFASSRARIDGNKKTLPTREYTLSA